MFHPLLIVLCTLLLCTCTWNQFLHAHEIPPNLRAFDLDPVSQDKRMYTVHSSDGSAQCIFSFTTVDCKRIDTLIRQKKPQDPPKPTKPKSTKDSKQSYLNIKNHLNTGCTQLDKGYWTYKVCFGGEITQSHGQDIYTLGRAPNFANDNDATLSTTYGNGQHCEPTNSDRSTKLNFFCTKHLQVLDVREPSQCKYEIDVGHPRLCGPSSPFQKGHAIPVSTSGGHSKPTVHLAKDPFLLSIESIQSSDSNIQTYDCSLKSTLHHLKQSPSVCFKSYTLEIKKTQSSSFSLSYVAHSSFLERMSTNDITKHNLGISTTTAFKGGPIEFLSLTIQKES